MERIDSIMEKLGFNNDAEDSAKAAFVKNLIKQAYGINVPLPPQYAEPQKPTVKKFEQLSFDFEIKTNKVG